ncbi:MAG: hypothetical protein ACPGSC_13325 [Granulosicoccaceae bacterium]
MSNIIDKLAWLYVQDGMLLVARLQQLDVFYLPSDLRRADETPERNLQRAIQESFSVKLKLDTIQAVGTFCAQAEREVGNVQVQLCCHFGDCDGEIRPQGEVAEIRYVLHRDMHLCSSATGLAMQWLYEQKLIN